LNLFKEPKGAKIHGLWLVFYKEVDDYRDCTCNEAKEQYRIKEAEIKHTYLKG
jgi:hypothetical protein